MVWIVCLQTTTYPSPWHIFYVEGTSTTSTKLESKIFCLKTKRNFSPGDSRHGIINAVSHWIQWTLILKIKLSCLCIYPHFHQLSENSNGFWITPVCIRHFCQPEKSAKVQSGLQPKPQLNCNTWLNLYIFWELVHTRSDLILVSQTELKNLFKIKQR